MLRSELFSNRPGNTESWSGGFGGRPCAPLFPRLAPLFNFTSAAPSGTDSLKLSPSPFLGSRQPGLLAVRGTGSLGVNAAFPGPSGIALPPDSWLLSLSAGTGYCGEPSVGYARPGG